MDTSDRVLLVRIDERLRNTQEDVADLRKEVQAIKEQSSSTEKQLSSITDKWKTATFIILTIGAAGGWLIDTLLKVFLRS